jgi:hypothetical protein
MLTWKQKDIDSGYLPPWEKNKENGKTPYIYMSKPLGSRCVFTCTWILGDNKRRILKPQGQPSVQEQLAELSDYIYMDIDSYYKGIIAKVYVSLSETGKLGKYGQEFKKVIRSVKDSGNLPVYLANWVPVEQIDFESLQVLPVRPGWELPAEYTKAFQEARREKLEKNNQPAIASW